MSDSARAFYYNPPWYTRIWQKLGFGHAHVDRPDDAVEGFCESYMLSNTVARLDWSDRLRVLISGKVSMQCLTLTDVPVMRTRSTSAVRILPPNEKI